MSLIVRQGLDADRLLITFASGEIVWTTDSNRLFVGNGIALGGIDIISQLHDHNDLYYIKSEITSLLSTKLDIIQHSNHILDASIHFAVDDSQVSLVNTWSSSKISSGVSSKAALIHDHNASYYLQSEVDAAIAAIPQPNIEVYLAPIGGRNMPVYMDPDKGKVLSSAFVLMEWSENRLGNMDWVGIGKATDIRSGHVCPFNATIVGMAMSCSSAAVSDIELILTPGTSQVIHSIGSTGDYVFSDTSLNIDVAAGSKIRLRHLGSRIEDTVIVLHIQWRA